MNCIKKKYPNYDDEKLEVIEYGLESLYIMVTKTIVISLIALVLNVFKEMLIIMILISSEQQHLVCMLKKVGNVI